MLLGGIKEEVKAEDAKGYSGFNWVDVRDVGDVHAESMLTEAAGGQRIIVAVGS